MMMPDYIKNATLDRYITVETTSTYRNASGEEIITWVPLCTRWAEMKTLAGNENTSSHRETASSTVTFLVRYVHNLTEKCRITYKNTVYDITHIVEHGRQHFHTIETEVRR